MLISCTDPAMDREVEVSEVALEVHRLDVPLFDSGRDLTQVHAELLERYPAVYPAYFKDILQLGDPQDSTAVGSLEQFVQFPDMEETQQQIDSVFGEFPDLQADLENAFGRYKNIFPEKDVPRIFLFNTGFNYGVYPNVQANYLGIGSEFFLGTENPVVTRLPNEVFPAYIRKQMIPEQLFPSAVKGWILSTYNEPPSKVDLINLMVTYGKIMYTLHLCIPDTPEYLHFSYTPEQMAWCETHEQEIPHHGRRWVHRVARRGSAARA